MWLLAEAVLKALSEAREAGLQPTAAQKAEFVARAGDKKKKMWASSGTVDIMVTGVLTKEPDLFAALFGGGNTAYTDIQKQLALAAESSMVSGVRMVVDSPGGHVDGLFDTLAAIEAFEKPIEVVASNAQSAAYAIAAAAGPITATNNAATFGSIGIARTMMLDDRMVTLTNSDSPDKRPDPTTDEGRAVIVKQLDAMHELFVENIASNRGVSTATVNKDFGRGATLLAGEAKRLGMIDGIAETVLHAVPQTNATAPRGAEGKAMTLEELKAQHPALYQAVFALGKDEGVAEERERVCGHLKVGEAHGALDVSLKAIKEGTTMTFGVQADYMAAMANNRDKGNRSADDGDAANALDGGTGNAGEGDDDLGMQTADVVDKLLGINTRTEA